MQSIKQMCYTVKGKNKHAVGIPVGAGRFAGVMTMVEA
ncbi:hypothetical protein AR1Y2_1638 [Anaerostipes rhamnosivorans]|uniref:Uncharacterized protein n=1 Tax=Anaerostipes rhamnosivorans TaxID=1229621 RepID=A0A4P8IBM9_9FIRM|nr:hypothetical protein AR1Y2_1638 [Anaerostipes rhamnosivorans]